MLSFRERETERGREKREQSKSRHEREKIRKKWGRKRGDKRLYNSVSKDRPSLNN